MPVRSCLQALSRTRMATRPGHTPNLVRTAQHDNGINDIYTPLDETKRQMRLLRLEANSGQGIALTLEVFSLDDKPTFTALSYLWTKREAKHCILVNHQLFRVRPNLYHYFKLMQQESDARWIFIDAICINQSDIAERSSQVSLMGTVYRAAELVAVWLGVLSPGYERDLAAAWFSRSNDVGTYVQQNELDEARRPLIEEVLDLFIDCEYWGRVWIVQEVLAARELLFRRGPLRADAHAMYRMMEIRDGMHDDEGLNLLSGDMEAFLYLWSRRQWAEDLTRRQAMAGSLVQQWHGQQKRETEAQSRSMSEVLTYFSGQACSVEYDKVYGLLGLTTSLCKVDYKMPKTELYLRILIESQLQQHTQDLSNKTANANFCTVLLAALGLKIESPAVYLVTATALTLCGSSPLEINEMITMTLYSRYPIRNTAHELARFARAVLAMKILKRQLAYYRRFPRAKLPTCDSLGPKTYSEWLLVLGDIFEEVEAQIGQSEEPQGASEAAAGSAG